MSTCAYWSFARKETNVKVKLGNDVQILFSYAIGARWINNTTGVMYTMHCCYELRFTWPQAFLTDSRRYDRIQTTQSVSLLIDTPLTHLFDYARCDARSRSVTAIFVSFTYSYLLLKISRVYVYRKKKCFRSKTILSTRILPLFEMYDTKGTICC